MLGGVAMRAYALYWYEYLRYTVRKLTTEPRDNSKVIFSIVLEQFLLDYFNILCMSLYGCGTGGIFYVVTSY